MKFKLILLIFLLIVASFIVTLNIFVQQNYQSEMAAQFNQQQLIIAKTIERSITNTIVHLEEKLQASLRLLAYMGLSREGIDEFVGYLFSAIRKEFDIDIFILDRKQRIIYTNIPDASIDEDLRGLFEKAITLKDGETYLIEDLSGKRQLRFASPVRRGNNLKGVVILSLNIDDITRKFLAPVKSGERGYAWMMDGMGTLIYHPAQPEMIGKNIFRADKSCFGCHKSFKTEQQIVTAQDVGFSSYVDLLGEDKLLAFSMTNLKGINWIVCVSTPYSEVTVSIKKSMRLHSMLIISILIATVIGASVIIIINRERIKAEARSRYTDKIREYAKELESIVHERTVELKSEKEKLDAIVSSIEAGICIFDEDLRPVWFNRVMQEWLPGELLDGFTFHTIYKDSHIKEVICGAMIENRFVREVAYLELGEMKGFFQITSTPLHTSDGHCQIMMLIQDITEIKKAEDQLIQSEKLAALARLSAGVSHEIGNPLTSISSYVQILRDMDFDAFTKDALDTIARHINRIATIVRQMSSFSKTQPEEIRPCNLKELLSSTVDLVKYDKRTKALEISIDIPEDIPQVTVDGNQIVQVFMNLILNAADAMPEGGRLTITGGRMDGDVEISFKDTGHGIRKEHLGRIFDPFFTTKDRGTGLGLAVSYTIVKSFGGNILVESSPGEGSTFRVRLPLHEK